MDREQALTTLNALWDVNDNSARMLLEVVSELGLADALTDEALQALATRHSRAD